jgi:hypothetical protein
MAQLRKWEGKQEVYLVAHRDRETTIGQGKQNSPNLNLGQLNRITGMSQSLRKALLSPRHLLLRFISNELRN